MEINETICCVIEDEPGFPPQNGAEFIKWLTSKVLEAPEEYRDSVKIELSVDHGYEAGDAVPVITIDYTRPMTEEEISEQNNKKISGIKQSIHFHENQTAILKTLLNVS